MGENTVTDFLQHGIVADLKSYSGLDELSVGSRQVSDIDASGCLDPRPVLFLWRSNATSLSINGKVRIALIVPQFSIVVPDGSNL